MILSDLSVKRPVFATVITLLLVAFGLFSLLKLSVREYPDIDPPIVSIQTVYPGAAANIVETKVTQILEDQISGIEGVRTIESQSRDGQSNITIEFNLSRDIDAAANDIRDRISRAIEDLPLEADPPEISKADTDSSPILWLVLSSPSMSSLELTDYAERNLVDRFAALDGVSQVRIGGERRYAMRVWLDRKALAARNVTVADVERILRAENVELPAGRLESQQREFTLRTAREYQTSEDFKKLVVARGENGYLVRLGEVADVEVEAENLRTEFRTDGEPTIGLGIIRQSQANTLEVARLAKAEMQTIAESLPTDMVLQVNSDYSLFIDASLNEVVYALFIAGLLVILIIYLFLGSVRATFIPAITVPISIIASFIFLYVLGFSINVLTLLALVLAIGLVVDDTIVVVENIYRRIEAGEQPLLAAYKGAREVGFAVVATTVVLVAVFVPMAFLEGNVGRLFAEFALAMASAVACSSIVALSLAPVLCSKLLRHDTNKPWLVRTIDKGFVGLSGVYRRQLALALRHPVVMVVLVVGLVGAIGWLLTKLPSEFAPSEDRGQFFVTMSAPEGSSLEYSARHLKEIEAAFVKRIGKGEIERVIVRIPGFGSSEDQVNTGIALASLTPWKERDRSAQEITTEISKELSSLPGVRAFAAQRPSFGQRGIQQPLQLVIGGSTYEELAKWRDIIIERASDNPNLNGLDSDYKETKPEIEINISRDRAAELGVSIETIGQTLETMLGSRRVTTYIDRGEEYDVMLQVRDRDRQTVSDLTNIYVRSDRSGQLIPLSNLVTTTEKSAVSTYNRYDRLRAITISANLADGYSLDEAITYLEGIVAEELPGAARISYKGEARELKESSQTLYATFALALLVVYLILAAQFESFVHPAVIMTTVPLAVFGALVGLMLMGLTLNIYSQIGMIMLIGLAAKNGILIVEFTNQMRDAGLEFMEALIEASVIRFRPIIMTSLSTAMGVIPLVFASGAGAEARSVIGVVVFSGVVFSTLLTLFVVPVFYDLMCRRTSSPDAVARQLKAQQQREVAA